MTDRFFKIEDSHDGQGMVEYSLILVLVALTVFAALAALGPILNDAFDRVVGSFG